MITTASLRPKRRLLSFNSDFQRKLVRTMYQDPPFAESLVGIFDTELLESFVLRWFGGKVLWFHRTYKSGPSLGAIERELDKEIKTGRIKGPDAVGARTFLRTLDNPTPDRSYIESEVYTFIKRARTVQTIQKLGELIKKNDFENVDKELASASVFKPKREAASGFILATTTRQRILRRLKQHEFGIASGTPIDKVMKSEGIQKGQLGVIVGPSGRGKTAQLVHQAATAAEDGEKVWYVSFELDEWEIADRFDARLNSIDMNDLRKKPQTIQAAYLARLKHTAERIRVDAYPSGSMTVAGLKAEMKKLEKDGFYPTLIVVDYADLMKPSGTFKGDDDYHGQGEIYRDLRGLAGFAKLAIWTASQANRPAMDAETVDKQHVADSLQKVMIADILVTQSQTPEEKADGYMRLFLAKSRNGYDGLTFWIKLNTAQCRVVEIPPPKRTALPGQAKKPAVGKALVKKATPISPVPKKNLSAQPAAVI